MKIILIHKANLEFRPPVISSIFNLIDLGHEVTLINSGVNDYWRKILDEQGVAIYTIPNRKGGIINKVLDYYSFKKNVYKILNKLLSSNNEALLWIEGAYTLVALGSRIKRYRYILQIQELHETFKYQLNAIGKVIHNAEAIFMPEYNRTALYQVWFKLNKRPIILPNKPYFLPTLNELKELEKKYAQQLSVFRNKKVVLYQGHISCDRDLSSYVQAIRELGNDYQLVLLGHDHGVLKKYKEIDPNLIHIDFIPAPDYLIFTSYAYIGILSYSPVSINNLYCAPNKIYEYTAFQLPILGNDIPGLYYPLNMFNLGMVVDENDVESIKSAIIEMDKNHDKYQEASKIFFDSVDNKSTIDNVLRQIELG